MVARIALVTVVLLAVLAPPGNAAQPDVPGAQHQQAQRVADLTTAGGHTNPADWAGLTHAALPLPPAVAGIQIDGYFPDSSTTNTNNGWNHDSQFVLRMPDRWNGGLVVAGPPGNRRQYANDRAISDWVLSRGYAFAATDKGNTGVEFYRDGDRPGDAIVEWNFRLTQLTIAARAAVAHHYGRQPARTIAAGMSNGGYLVRWQLENVPWLYDGGIDWEGVLWTVNGPNLFTYLPDVLRAYPDREGMLRAGFPAESEFLWPYHNQVYWSLTQRIYRQELDPAYTGAEADYDYAARPAAKRAVARIALTGRIGKPLITLHGTLDSLLPIGLDSDVYARMVAGQGRGELHRYHRIEGGNHVDGLVDAFPSRLTPIGPYFRTAVTELESFMTGCPGWQPPPRSSCA
jgi:hypothetical protein